MPDRRLLAKIHIAKKELNLQDEHYRNILNQKFGVSSSAFLSDSQASVLITSFKGLGWVPRSKPKKYDDQKGDVYSATPAQKRLIEALWHDLYRGNNETKHLRQFLWNHVKVSDVAFLTRDTAHKAIEAMKAMTDRRRATEDSLPR